VLSGGMLKNTAIAKQGWRKKPIRRWAKYSTAKKQ